MAVFYGHVTNEQFKKQMKESRKIEELILMFATHATGVLKKEPSLAGDGWKLELNNQISLFVKMLRECLRTVGHVSPELIARLDMYTAKLAPSQTANDSGYDSPSTSRTDRETIGSPKISGQVTDMSLVRTVAQLFKIPEVAIQKEVDQMRKYCTDKVCCPPHIFPRCSLCLHPGRVDGPQSRFLGLMGLLLSFNLLIQTCLKNLVAGASFPGSREDFSSDSAWHTWRTQETATLSQLMLSLAQLNPELAKSTPADSMPITSNTRPGSVYSPSGIGSRHASIGSRRSFYDSLAPEGAVDEVNGDDDISVDHNFIYIPPNPKKYYKRLLELCLVADLEVMLSPETEETDEVSLGILSLPHLELLNECAIRWRIGHPYRAVCFLDLVKQFFERGEIPMECVPEALQGVERVINDVALEKWAVQDVRDYLSYTYMAFLSMKNNHGSLTSWPMCMVAFSTPFYHCCITQWTPCRTSRSQMSNLSYSYWTQYETAAYLSAST